MDVLAAQHHLGPPRRGPVGVDADAGTNFVAVILAVGVLAGPVDALQLPAPCVEVVAVATLPLHKHLNGVLDQEQG